MTINRGDESVGAEYGKTLSADRQKHLQIQSAGAVIASGAGRKIEYERGIHKPNRMRTLTQGHNMHGDYQNRGGVASTDLLTLRGGNVPKIFAVFGADKFFREQAAVNFTKGASALADKDDKSWRDFFKELFRFEAELFVLDCIGSVLKFILRAIIVGFIVFGLLGAIFATNKADESQSAATRAEQVDN